MGDLVQKLRIRMINALADVSRIEKSLVRITAVTDAGLSSGLLINQYLEISKLLHSDDLRYWSILIDYTSFWGSFRVTLALIVVSVSLWRFTANGFLISIVGLLWVGTEYILRYILLLNLKEDTGGTELQQISLSDLIGSTYWDLAIFVLTLMLFMWAIKIIIQMYISPPNGRSGNSESSKAQMPEQI